ncbi:long-chain-fatty-acid--AMP ligase FadD26-like [Juglans microcarpa x Juglans regia]|uniref:long-chain-fatty-acid--AMP ligase FadD26-like n=1 Tax=Juglans microcarpa x Juglans regia TaxID=2249226 RepID=UPI001B7F423C|nr:long-chain-fatty-acid--AMP ligase FadD26-like [Juglans microcarpa x Juglans regia]
MHANSIINTKKHIYNMNHENYDLSFPDQPVVDLYLPIWANLPAFLSKPAFIWVEDDDDHSNHAQNCTTLTYAQLHDSVQSISSQLLIPLQRGDTVVILCSPGLELVEFLFGCQRAGLLTVPIFPPDPSFAKENYHHLVRVLSQTRPKAAIAHRDYIASVQRYVSSSSIDKKLAQMLLSLKWISTDDIKDKSSDSKWSSSGYNGCKPDEVYLVQYTSGATGIPKPVLVTAGSAAHNVRTARKAYDLHPNSMIVSWLPQYHDCGLMFLLLTIVSGATCVLSSPGAFVKRPRLWLELISEFKATCTPVPSFTLPLVVKRGGMDKESQPINLWSLRNLIIINEPIYRASVEEFVDVFKPFGLSPSCIAPSYGLAENCTFVSTAWKGNNGNSPMFPNILTHNKLLPAARLALRCEDEEEDMDIIVMNEETYEPVEDGIEGEIWVSSPSNASGYLGHPFLTRKVFQARLNSKNSKCFVRTGDRGIVIGEERYLFVTGRCSDVIKLHNTLELHPHYIETTAYKSCPKFLRGGCLAAFEISDTVVLVAELQRTEHDVRFLRSLCEGIRKRVLEEEKVELGYVVLVRSGSLPKTTSGKIQRWAAKDKLMEAKMSIVMDIRYGECSSFLLAGAYETKERFEGRGRGQEKREVATGKREEIFHSLSSSRPPSRPSLLSLL